MSLYQELKKIKLSLADLQAFNAGVTTTPILKATQLTASYANVTQLTASYANVTQLTASYIRATNNITSSGLSVGLINDVSEINCPPIPVVAFNGADSLEIAKETGDIFIGGSTIADDPIDSLITVAGTTTFHGSNGLVSLSGTAANIFNAQSNNSLETFASVQNTNTNGNKKWGLVTGAGAGSVASSGKFALYNYTDNKVGFVIGINGITGSTIAIAANVYIDPSTGQLFRSTSSRKYKKNIYTYEKGLEQLLKLRPVSFESINDETGKKFAGFIAEELDEQGLKEFVDYANNQPEAINYANMVSILTKAIQELAEKVKNLENKISSSI